MSCLPVAQNSVPHITVFTSQYVLTRHGPSRLRQNLPFSPRSRSTARQIWSTPGTLLDLKVPHLRPFTAGPPLGGGRASDGAPWGRATVVTVREKSWVSIKSSKIVSIQKGTSHDSLSFSIQLKMSRSTNFTFAWKAFSEEPVLQIVEISCSNLLHIYINLSLIMCVLLNITWSK